MPDKSRLVARCSSNHNCIGAQMNDKIKRAIYELITSRTDQTYKSQIFEINSKFW